MSILHAAIDASRPLLSLTAAGGNVTGRNKYAFSAYGIQHPLRGRIKGNLLNFNYPYFSCQPGFL
jgi:hypothetical protein